MARTRPEAAAGGWSPRAREFTDQSAKSCGMPGPKILVVGEFRQQMYEASFCDALRRAGAQVWELNVTPLFGPGELINKAQEKLGIGPGPIAANAALIARSVQFRPDII